MEKIAFFDFNGTLTKNNNSYDFLVGNKKFGFKRFVYKFLGFIPFVRILGLKIVGKKLKRKKISWQFVEENSLKIELKENITAFLNTLQNIGYKIVIISGGFEEIIEPALKENIFLVDKIYANNLIFKDGFIETIKANDIDFKGKKRTILNCVKEENAVIQKCLFICNSFNDKYALKLPIKKFTFDKTLNKKNVTAVDNLMEILKLI